MLLHIPVPRYHSHNKQNRLVVITTDVCIITNVSSTTCVSTVNLFELDWPHKLEYIYSHNNTCHYRMQNLMYCIVGTYILQIPNLQLVFHNFIFTNGLRKRTSARPPISVLKLTIAPRQHIFADVHTSQLHFCILNFWTNFEGLNFTNICRICTKTNYMVVMVLCNNWLYLVHSM